jgi:hypothetical protein
MMLVLVAMGIATILAVAYLSSRDNSAVIGVRITDQAEARWLAQSGLDVGVALLETGTNWRTKHDQGLVIDDLALGNGTIDLRIMDLTTNAPPTESTTDVAIVATASIGDIFQQCLATAHVPLNTTANTVDVDLSEFAVFTGDSLEMRGESTITRWTTAPSSLSAAPLSIGTCATHAQSIVLNDDAAAIDTTVYHGPHASASLIGGTSPNPLNEFALQNQLPLPAPPVPAITTISGTPDTLQANGATINTDRIFQSITVSNAPDALTITGETQLVTESSFIINENAGIIVDGHATIVVFGDMQLQPNARIVLTEDSTLTAFVFGNMTMRDTFIGRESTMIRDASGDAEYVDPQTVRIFSIAERTNQDGGTEAAGSRTWNLDEGTIIVGTLYAPNVELHLRSESAVYGNLVAQTLSMEDESAIFYDQALDLGYGFTNALSPIFNADGTINTSVLNLSDLSAHNLAALAAALGGMVVSNGGSYGTVPAGTPDDADSHASTPRLTMVDFDQTSFGTATSTWEGSAGGNDALIEALESLAKHADAQLPGDMLGP